MGGGGGIVGEEEVVFSAQRRPFGVGFANYAHRIEGERGDVARGVSIERRRGGQRGG